MTISHRPGVLIVDELGLAMADLDRGEVRRLDSPFPSPVDWESMPELAPLSGVVPPPVPSMPVADAPILDVGRALTVDGPVALRLDNGHVLAWDDRCRSHVGLTALHLQVLGAASAVLTVGDLVNRFGAPAAAAAGELEGLGVLRLVETESMGTLSGGFAIDNNPVGGEPMARDSRDRSEVSAAPPPRARVLAHRALGRVRRRRRAVIPGETGPVGRPVNATSGNDQRVPVIPLYRWSSMSTDEGFGEMVEPSLSVGMLFAAARAHDGGRLEQLYDLRRMQPDMSRVFDEWAQDPRPAIFVFSDYLWNISAHLDLSARVKEISPASICIHGGPSVPKHEIDAAVFFANHPSVDIAARGEGEITFAEILDALDGDLAAGCIERLRDVRGITIRLRSGAGEELVRTGERERLTNLNVIPSPFLTGEFDDLLSAEWRCSSIETNRGCPYGCTFCDWGSATLSRIRRFDLDRVKAELDWIIERAAPSELFITDANVGIYSRDVEIAEHIAKLRRRHGAPYAVVLNLAKNTAKYTKQIIQTLVAAGVQPITASSAVQSVDPETLRAVRRENISLEKYDEIASTFQEVGIPLTTDLLMGLPGATFETFKNDLQHCFDREVTPRTMEIVLLPNSPMNDPGYREEFAIRVDEHGIVVETSTYTADDYERMKRLRLLYRAADHFGALRHVLRLLQWDYDLRAIDVLADLDDAVTNRGNRYPLLAFFCRLFDLYTIPPVAWEPFYDEFGEFARETYGLELGSDLATVLVVQRSLMPSRTRSYPIKVELAHDFVAYRNDRLTGLTDGTLSIRRPLRRYPPGELRVDDPAEISREFVKRNDFEGRRLSTANLFWMGFDWELDSPLIRHLATNVGRYATSNV